VKDALANEMIVEIIGQDYGSPSCSAVLLGPGAADSAASAREGSP
jgi:hypothetical protein